MSTGSAPLAGVIVAITLSACSPPYPPPGAMTLDDVIAADLLAGDWQWHHDEIEAGTLRREHERWSLVPTDDRLALRGHYRREIWVRALDQVPFACSQRDTYSLRADHDLLVHIIGGEAIIEENGYRTAPSPCDPGLRRETVYRAKVALDHLVMRWDRGESRLVRVDPTAAAAVPPSLPPSPAPPQGPWTWVMTSWTRAGLIQSEAEAWELTTRGDTLAGTYLRTITVRTPDGSAQPCADGPEYRYVDRYLVVGRRDQDTWRIEEVGSQAGNHPCLAATPSRSRDAATFTIEGEFLVLEWRGKRRQVLGRPWADQLAAAATLLE